jgi:DNA-binding NtrC family response regulator
MTDGEQLLTRLATGPIPSLILLDVQLPGRDGIEIIEKINEAHLRIPVIMLSGMRQTRTVVEAMKLGASDFLLKPIDEEALTTAIRNVIEKAEDEESESEDFVTANPRMRRLAQIVKRVAPTDVPLLIFGESGVLRPTCLC